MDRVTDPKSYSNGLKGHGKRFLGHVRTFVRIQRVRRITEPRVPAEIDTSQSRGHPEVMTRS